MGKHSPERRGVSFDRAAWIVLLFFIIVFFAVLAAVLL